MNIAIDDEESHNILLYALFHIIYHFHEIVDKLHYFHLHEKVNTLLGITCINQEESLPYLLHML